jgi:hypothetical protein
MQKTSILAQFGSPEEVRIILTRRKEQLLPLRKMGYQFAQCENAEALRFALMHPEDLWPGWENGERMLAVDDITEGVHMLVDDAEFKDARKSFLEAGKEMREMLKINLGKRRHLGIIALARTDDNPITNEQTIGPDLPPSILRLLVTEFEFTFYAKRAGLGRVNLVTDRDFISFTEPDPETRKPRTVKRIIFSKNKIPLGTKNPLLKEEPGDLRAIWNKVKPVINVPKAAIGGTSASATKPAPPKQTAFGKRPQPPTHVAPKAPSTRPVR